MPWGGVWTLLTRCKSGEFFKNFAKRIYSKSRKNRHKKINSKGTVLIEFAICIPILVILLFYAHDLVLLYRWRAQTEFTAQQTINMIQNISQKRGNKAITQEDLKLIYRANNFNLYPTTLEVRIPSSATLGSPYFLIYYMKGEAGGKVSILWQRALYHPHLDRTSPYIGSNIWWCGRSIEPCQIGTYDASQIDQSLKINEGEVKIMVDIILRVQPDCVKEILGLYLVSPKINARQFSFNHIAFFTPKPGLFDENGPQ